MGFLSKLLGGNNNDQQATAQPTDNGGLQLHKGLNLTKEQSVENLNLRKETFSLVLTKSGLNDVQARIVFVMDKSGSARSLFSSGVVQRVIDRLLPVALRMDDNGELDMYLFSSDSRAFKRLDTITESDFYQYVDREIVRKPENNFWGGTEYAPIINEIVKQYGINDPSSTPTFVIFITDGANSDRNATKEAITNAAHYPIFWQFIGLNPDESEFDFLKRLDDLKGRVIDNADFFHLNDVDKISDEVLYSRLMTEYPSWVRQARAQGILR